MRNARLLGAGCERSDALHALLSGHLIELNTFLQGDGSFDQASGTFDGLNLRLTASRHSACRKCKTLVHDPGPLLYYPQTFIKSRLYVRTLEI